jgi:hypothetical protein
MITSLYYGFVQQEVRGTTRTSTGAVLQGQALEAKNYAGYAGLGIDMKANV